MDGFKTRLLIPPPCDCSSEASLAETPGQFFVAPGTCNIQFTFTSWELKIFQNFSAFPLDLTVAYIRLAPRHVMLAQRSEKKEKKQRPSIRRVSLARLGHRTQNPELRYAPSSLLPIKVRMASHLHPWESFSADKNQPGTLINPRVTKPSACSCQLMCICWRGFFLFNRSRLNQWFSYQSGRVRIRPETLCCWMFTVHNTTSFLSSCLCYGNKCILSVFGILSWQYGSKDTILVCPLFYSGQFVPTKLIHFQLSYVPVK